MEKALNTLKELCLVINFNSYWKPRVNEAISELEETMKHKTCEGCVYENKDVVLHVECAFCLRNSNDNFKPKDTQC